MDALAAISLNWRSGILILAALAFLGAFALCFVPSELPPAHKAGYAGLFLFAVGMALWAAGVN